MHRLVATTAILLMGAVLSPAQALPLPAMPDGVYLDLAGFNAATGASLVESFETVTTSPRGLDEIAAPLLTLRTTTTPIGLLDGPDGFGGAASDGQRFVSVYLPGGVSQGTVQLVLAAPTQALGLTLVDLGEVAGVLTLTTDTGFHASGTVLANFAGGLDSGNQQFFGISQAQAFSTVWITSTGLDDAYGIDQVRLQAPVPEPGQWALMALGLAALAAWRHPRHRAR